MTDDKEMWIIFWSAVMAGLSLWGWVIWEAIKWIRS